MKKTVVVILILGFIISACGPSESAIKTAVAQTLTSSQSVVTKTQPPPPLEQINLDGIILQQGDLSTMFIGEQINYS